MSPMLQYTIVAVLAAVGAAVLSAIILRSPLPPGYMQRVLVGSLILAFGIFTTVFAVDGFGWGWPDPSRTQVILLLIIAGLSIGILNVLFGWLTARQLHVTAAVALLGANVGVALIPPENDIVRKFALAMVNFCLLSFWLARGRAAQLSR